MHLALQTLHLPKVSSHQSCLPPCHSCSPGVSLAPTLALWSLCGSCWPHCLEHPTLCPPLTLLWSSSQHTTFFLLSSPLPPLFQRQRPALNFQPSYLSLLSIGSTGVIGGHTPISSALLRTTADIMFCCNLPSVPDMTRRELRSCLELRIGSGTKLMCHKLSGVA